MPRVRSPAVAGSFYPSETWRLKEVMDQCLVGNPLGPKGAREPRQSLIGGMVPHAGYVYSGACAAHFFARLHPMVERVIVLGVNHSGRGHRAALSPHEYWQTPLGKINIDHELNQLLKRSVAFLQEDAVAHSQEHSIEVQLPFLQLFAKNFFLLPIALSRVSLDECRELALALAEYWAWQSKRTVVLASSDLSHYLSPVETEKLDRIALDAVLSMRPAGLLGIVEKEHITMCGVLPAVVLLYALEALGVTTAQLLMHYHSGAVRPMSEVVGYASVAFEH
jgi:AmmeMemoRadiSam system protein B